MKRSLASVVVLLSALAAKADSELSNELALVERWLGAQRAYDGVPGLSVAVVHDQDLLWSGASGFADLEKQREAKADTIYGICSISKLFTGIAVMQLRDQGKFTLDDPLSDLLPWFNLRQAHPESPEITLRAVLSHSAGLPRESDVPYWMGPDYPFPTRDEVREILGSQATLYPAEQYYQYSNLGLTLAGEVVAEKSGHDYETWVRERILKPLGLRDTDTGFPTDERKARIATGYAFPGRNGKLIPLPRYDARGITPAAGFASTALDLARFASWQFRVRNGESDEVLQRNTLREMQRVHWMDWDFSTSWGLAFGIYRRNDRTLTGHSGGCPGFNTRLYLDPVSEYAVVVMANRNRVDVSHYAATVFDILEAGSTPDPAEDSNGGEPVDFDAYTGSYDLHPWDGEVLVFPWEDGLAVVDLPTMEPLDNLVRLQHIEGDTFRTIRSDDELGHEVLFQRDRTGAVSQMVSHSNDLPKISNQEAADSRR